MSAPRPIRSTSTLSSSCSDALASRRRPGISSAPLGDCTTRQTSDRGSNPSVANSGLLQSNILGAQEGWRFPTSIRLEGSECLCLEGEVQNDHSSSSDKRIAQRRLGSQHRSKRNLFPRPHSCQITPPVKIRSNYGRRALHFPIQSSPVRSDIGPEGVYESNPTRGAECSHASCLSSSVPRRLVTEKSRQATTGPPDKRVARCHTPSGLPTQRAKITVGTHSALDTHRCGIPARHRADVSSDGKSSDLRRQNPCTSYGPSDNGLCLAVTPRSPEFSNICHPTRSIAPQTSAALSTGSLGAHVKELAGVDPSETRSVGPPSPLVVGQRVNEGRNTTRCTSGSDPSVYSHCLILYFVVICGKNFA